MADREFSLGPFRLNLGRRELSREGSRVQLGSRALEILCILASANGALVSKGELMTRVWPGLAVEENNIQVHVSALRKALEEAKSGQNYLLTVPGRGYRLIGLLPAAPHTVGTPENRQTLPVPARPSIAVLPFNNLSGDPAQEYFADGMVEEVITGLSRIKWLSVVSRNSSFTFKNKPMTMAEVADKLGVRYVLEGSVRKSENRVRIAAQLINVETDAHLWAEQYDRLLEDVFAIQDEITMRVVGAIEPSLRNAEIDRVRRHRPNNLNAYDLVLRSLPFVFAQMPTEATKAIPLLEEALRLQPDYGGAHAFLGWCLHHRFARGGLREADRDAAIRHVYSAIAYGNDDATAIAIAAHVIALDEHDTTAALQLFERSLELSNSNVFALSLSAIILAWMGNAELAIERAKLALHLSPCDIYNFRSHHALAIAYFQRENYADALRAARNAITANPNFSVARAVLAAVLFRLGRVTTAKAAAQEVLDREPTFTIRGTERTGGALEPRVFEPFAKALREIGLPE